MECIRWFPWFIEFSFSGQQRKLFKLKNLGSLREFMRVVLHIPSLKEEEEGPQEVRGGLVKPKVRPSLLEFLLSRPLAFWTVDVVQHVWGRDLEWGCKWWFGEISPTLILVPLDQGALCWNWSYVHCSLLSLFLFFFLLFLPCKRLVDNKYSREA